ncbi:MAG: hypothetical protein IJL94_01180 [Erysipelotrichaceae bacterium]|nr:hypothetical protein [Erysipelotrichaceae bacterium]
MIFYIIAFVISVAANLELLAEAPLKFYHFLAAFIFMAAKTYISLSRKHWRYSACLSFCASLFLICIYVMNDVPEMWLFVTLYVLTCIPCAPIAMSLAQSWRQIVLILLIIQLIFLALSVFMGSGRFKWTKQ